MTARPSPRLVPPRRPLVAVPPPRIPEPTQADPDPQLQLTYWNTRCGHVGCTTWVPRHRTACAAHAVPTTAALAGVEGTA